MIETKLMILNKLKSARQESGLTDDEICKRLGISHEVLKSIEKGECPEKMSSIHFRASMRGLLHLLNLDERLYLLRLCDSDKVLSSVHQKSPMSIGIIALIAAFVLLAGAGAFFLLKKESVSTPDVPKVIQQSDSSKINSDTLLATENPKVEAAIAAEPLDPIAAITQAAHLRKQKELLQKEALEASNSATTPVVAQNNTAAQVNEVAATTNNAVSTSETANSLETSRSTEVKSLTKIATGKQKLVLLFKESSWVRIVNQQGRIIKEGVYGKQNSPLEVDLPEMVQVSIQKPKSVTVFYEGKEQDLSIFSDKQANIILGGQ